VSFEAVTDSLIDTSPYGSTVYMAALPNLGALMIVCVEGPDTQYRKLNGAPGFDLIQDPIVAYACGAVFSSPDIVYAEAQLKKILDPALYVVGHGGSHIFVSQNIGPGKAGQRLAMLVDSNDDGIKWSFPALPDWQWSWP
jgi:hypothetical protein